MEIENNSKLSFLDILISRSNGQYMTGIFRKDTFTGLGLNFFSHSPLSFKINSCKTLLSRAFSLCSNWQKFHEEVSFLRSYFLKNCYPAFIFDKQIRNFLNDMFRPKPLMSTVPKMKLYVSLPFMNHTLSVQRELNDVLGKLYPYVDFKFVFRNFSGGEETITPCGNPAIAANPEQLIQKYNQSEAQNHTTVSIKQGSPCIKLTS